MPRWNRWQHMFFFMEATCFMIYERHQHCDRWHYRHCDFQSPFLFFIMITIRFAHCTVSRLFRAPFIALAKRVKHPRFQNISGTTGWPWWFGMKFRPRHYTESTGKWKLMMIVSLWPWTSSHSQCKRLVV